MRNAVSENTGITEQGRPTGVGGGVLKFGFAYSSVHVDSDVKW